MAGQLPLPDITKIGQTAVEIPQDVLGTEMRHVSEKMNVLNMEIQKLGLPVLGAGLPPLPGLPGAQAQPPEAQKEPATRGTIVKKTASYFKS